MINSKTALELQGVAALGGSLEVDGSRYTALELQGIAATLKPNAYLKVHNSASKTTMEMQGIAAMKPGQVVFA
ncbi:hypothetical protein [Bradyrhizobium sp. Ash2021]|uniref:hypothetical protein n=1 Tax=Bradyrhizobium sp. Ash2021 TaxID=2954771 RepID=UPI00281693B0|nr:hypothetical protein [Bradyrhizobium sp. Ash2021]WMT75896.1 hypothetical protein NL528_05675 [Bradyrhizobium sp. Ash2021]